MGEQQWKEVEQGSSDGKRAWGILEIIETWCMQGEGISIEGLWSFVLQQMASQRNQVQRQQALALMCRFVCSLS